LPRYHWAGPSTSLDERIDQKSTLIIKILPQKSFVFVQAKKEIWKNKTKITLKVI